MIISLATVLVTFIFTKGSVFVPFAQTMIDREKAKQLALSGIQIGIAQLSQQIDPEPKKDEKQPPAPTGPQAKSAPAPSPEKEALKELLERIVPTINRWQTFTLKEDVDGLDGVIKVCLVCEDGKIDINALYDFKKHQFRGIKEEQDILKKLVLETFKSIGKEDLFAEFEKFLKARQYRLDDVTELMTIKGFELFKNNIFYEPASFTKKDEGAEKKGQVYLTDIFTIWSGKQTIEPWLLSDSMCGLLGVKRVTRDDVKSRKELVKQAMKDFKTVLQWPADWNIFFAKLYGQDFTKLPKGIESILQTKVEPKNFSVLSYGTVGNVTQRLLAIVERVKEEKEKIITFTCVIKKLYWL